jgi:hypothetical protein
MPPRSEFFFVGCVGGVSGRGGGFSVGVDTVSFSLHHYHTDIPRFARQELARKQQEYEASLQTRIQEEVRDLQKQQEGGAHAAPSLASLPVLPYLDAEGKLSPTGADAKVRRK